MKVTINRWVDLVDRTAWAFVLSYASSLITLGWNSWHGSALSIAGMTALGALVKTGGAQQIGNSPIGDALPGVSVVKPTP